MTASAPTPALDGVRVLDLSRMLPGAALTRLLADLGATIIKVERPGAGDEIRADGTPVEGTTGTHAFLDRGKQSVALDLKEPEAVATVLRLAATCDAVVESFRPGVADRLGVGYDALRAVNPAIVFCSVNGYGTGGPLERAAGHDLGYIARAGVLNLGGTRADGPGISGAQLADTTGGALGAVGLLAALLRAQRTGQGDHIEVALADAALWAVGIHAANAFAGGADGPESSALNGAAACYRVYRCADGLDLSVGALEARFWAQFVDVVGDDSWLERRFDATLIPAVAARIAERPRAEWLDLLAGLDVCVEPVLTFAEVAEDEQFASRGMVVRGPAGEPRLGSPIRTGAPVPDLPGANPVVGGDTADVLGALGANAPARGATIS
ncbi:MAG: CaiB/BaiF CoA-transferase family protein [Solirubrobacteraceae bacterium]|nr:CaiB/BaiF CoA-transferase family protein [Patulibacter sp.]